MPGIFEKLIDAAVEVRKIDSLQDAASKQRATLATPELEEATAARIIDPLQTVAQRGSQNPVAPAPLQQFQLSNLQKAGIAVGGLFAVAMIVALVRQ